MPLTQQDIMCSIQQVIEIWQQQCHVYNVDLQVLIHIMDMILDVEIHVTAPNRELSTMLTNLNIEETLIDRIYQEIESLLTPIVPAPPQMEKTSGRCI